MKSTVKSTRSITGEILSALAMIGIAAVLITPLLGMLRAQTARKSCQSNLRSIFVALKAYQAQWDGDGQYGTISQMGLPPAYNIDKLGISSFPCPGIHPIFGPGRMPPFPYLYAFADPKPGTEGVNWAPYAKEYRENSILVFDINHNSAETPPFNFDFKHEGFGIYLSGQAVSWDKPGDWNVRRWWNR
jgi:hypothetical protein